MSIHKSLAVSSSLSRSRNVFTRAERLEALTKEGRWGEGKSVFGLPKVKTRARVRKVKKEKKVEDAAAAAAPGAATPAPAAAAAAAPAAKAKKK